jgi:hypothetical protein
MINGEKISHVFLLHIEFDEDGVKLSIWNPWLYNNYIPNYNNTIITGISTTFSNQKKTINYYFGYQKSDPTCVYHLLVKLDQLNNGEEFSDAEQVRIKRSFRR